MDMLSQNIKTVFENANIKDFSSLPTDKEDKQKFAKLFNEYNKYFDAAKIQGFIFDKSLPPRREEINTGKVDSEGMPIIEEIFVVPVPSEANISQQNYNALLQRYKDLSKEKVSPGPSGSVDIPYDIKNYITEINTGLIDTNYMNSKFVKFLKVLDSDKSEEIQEALNELHKTFGTLSEEEQKYANVFIHQVQSGDIKPDPKKTLRDYITEYMVSDKNKNIHDFATNFGVDEDKLINAIKFGIDDVSRFNELKDSIDRDKAKNFIEKQDGKIESLFKLNIKIESTLRTFVLEQIESK